MKTTNKLILGLLAVGIVIVTVLMIKIKANLVSLSELAGSGNVITETIQLDAFTDVNVAGNFKLILLQGDSHSVRITTDDNLMEYVMANVSDNKLTIRFDNTKYLHKRIDIYVTFAQLENLTLTAGSRATTEAPVKGSYLKHSVRSGGHSAIELEYDEIQLDAFAGSHVELSGTVRKLNIESNSGAQVKASGLIATECRLSSSSGALNEVYASNVIDASLSSGSQLMYYGNPQEKNISTSSGGQASAR